MNRKLAYKQYLKSADWQELRKVALARTQGFCQYCGELADQVHHVKYPKSFGEEHPHSLIPVCSRCHNISHGVQKMNELSNVVHLSDYSPIGARLNYIVSDARVYASARSWMRALQVPDCMTKAFEAGLSIQAMFKKDMAGGSLEMQFNGTPVYRWHAVGNYLRTFDREWYKTGYKTRPINEQNEINRFHDNYEQLINWGYDLQERAIASVINSGLDRNSPVTQENLFEAMKQVVAPRLHQHDEKLQQHEVIITEIKQAMPTMQDPDEFITVKGAIAEKGQDYSVMPLYPNNKDNLSSLVGKQLKASGCELGKPVVSRLDGQPIAAEMNTYRRRDIYKALEGYRIKQENLDL
jgi:hypothetical protein